MSKPTGLTLLFSHQSVTMEFVGYLHQTLTLFKKLGSEYDRHCIGFFSLSYTSTLHGGILQPTRKGYKGIVLKKVKKDGLL